VDAQGQMSITGGSDGSIDFGGGPIASSKLHVFVARLDGKGHHLCSRAFQAGTAELMAADTLAVNTSGDPLLTGFSIGSFDIDPGTSLDSDLPTAYLVRF